MFINVNVMPVQFKWATEIYIIVSVPISLIVLIMFVLVANRNIAKFFTSLMLNNFAKHAISNTIWVNIWNGFLLLGLFFSYDNYVLYWKCFIHWNPNNFVYICLIHKWVINAERHKTISNYRSLSGQN